MYTGRFFNVKNMVRSTRRQIILFALWSAIIVVLFRYAKFEWLSIPWVLVSLIGTAVAFYVGFKNNSAYGRTWEARKIWGAVVNSSRTWGIMVKDFVTNEYADEKLDDNALHDIHKRLIYRHMAWVYQMKRQLRVLKEWEHSKKYNEHYRRMIKSHFPSKEAKDELAQFIDDNEVKEILKAKNPATQLISRQSEELRLLKSKGLIDDFRHMELQKMLADLYTQQGKNERIKNFPLPRQYSSASFYFVFIFIFLLPMGLLSAFDSIEGYKIWSIVPFTVLVGWMFWIMELVGDYAENPFEHLLFDIPMDSLSRTIEIDLREMLKETDLPPSINSINNFVM